MGRATLIGLMGILSGPATAGDLTGIYGGVQLGQLDGRVSAQGRGSIGGVFIGYNNDNDRVVLGGELDYNTMDIDLGGVARIDGLARLKLRGGYLVGDAFLYGTAGAAMVAANPLKDSGYVFGAGIGYDLGNRMSLGSELLYHDIRDINNSGQDAEIITLSARLAFQF